MAAIRVELETIPIPKISMYYRMVLVSTHKYIMTIQDMEL